VNTSLASGFAHASGIAASGSDFVVSDMNMSTISEYTASVSTVGAPLLSGFYQPFGIAVSGSDLFIVSNGSGTISEYTTAERW